jgi:hypothetical protein
VKAAGVDIAARGTADAEKAALELKIDAPALADTRQRLEHGLHRAVPELSGAVHLAAKLRGPYKSPHVSFTTDVPTLTVGANHVEGLHANVDLTRLLPLPAGSFAGTLDRVLIGRNEGHDLALTGSIDGQKALVDATGTFKDTPVRLTVRGARQPPKKDDERWVMNTLHAEALGLALNSVHPTTLVVGHGRASISGFQVDGGPLGHIALDGEGGLQGPVRAHFAIQSLRVDELPEQLLPKNLQVGGTIDLDAKVRGSLDAPVADLLLNLSQGRYRGLKPFGVDTTVHYAEKHVTVSVAASFARGSLLIKAKAPTLSPKAALEPGVPPEPIELDVTMSHLNLATFAPLLKKEQAIAGDIDGEVDIDGTLQAPTLETHFQLSDFEGFGVDRLGLVLEATYKRDKLKLKLDAERPAGVSAQLTANTTVAIRPLLEGRKLDMKRLPLDVDLMLKEFDLSWLRSFGLGPENLAGVIAGKVTLDGTPSAPSANGTIKATSVVAGGYHDVNAILDMKAIEDIQVQAEVALGQVPVADLRFLAKVSPLKLAGMTNADKFKVPFELAASVHPTPLLSLLPPPPGSIEKPLYDANGLMTLTAFGTPDRPELHLSAGLQDMRFAQTQKPIGGFSVKLDYKNALTAFESVFYSQKSGALLAKATLQGPLGASVLSGGTAAVMGYPVHDFMVVAERLDLSLFDGFSQLVRGLAGILDLKVEPVNGDFALKDAVANLKGNVSVTNAGAAIAEFGSFSNVALKASGSGATQRFAVTDFHGKSGDGSFEVPKAVNGKEGIYVEKEADGLWGSSFALNLTRFPLVQSYQTRAVISMQVRTEKNEAPHKDFPPALYPITIDPASGPDHHYVSVGRLVFGRGHVTIPSTIPKSVQSLADNPDVVIASKRKGLQTSVTGHASQPWVIYLDDVVIPSTQCNRSTDTDCGQLAIDAPLGNKLVLSTPRGQSFDVMIDPSLAGGETPSVQVDGKILVEGTVSLLKARFEIDPFDVANRSSIVFAPDQPVSDPSLAIKAHSESDTQRVDVTLTGPVSNIQKRFDANPPMADDAEVYYFLATGQRQTRAQQSDPTSAQAQLADAGISALGSAAVGAVKDAVQSFLPSEARLDVLDIDPNVAGGGIGKVRAGKRYLGGSLQIVGQYNPLANPLLNENTYEIRTNYRIDNDKYLQGLAGTQGHYELKFLLQRDFCASRQAAAGLCSTGAKSAGAAAGTGCTAAQRRAGTCGCSAAMQAANQCELKSCVGQQRAADQCVCTPDAFGSKQCVQSPQ